MVSLGRPPGDKNLDLGIRAADKPSVYLALPLVADEVLYKEGPLVKISIKFFAADMGLKLPLFIVYCEGRDYTCTPSDLDRAQTMVLLSLAFTEALRAYTMYLFTEFVLARILSNGYMQLAA
ncbi:hypothetical protein PInf_017647 [Phytophthora infestans]|nr:hypothetical protein PInf_017647 [Phytophthora infestans]